MNKTPLPDHIVVWNQHFTPLYDVATDCDGRRIKKADYGKQTEYGWEIDHIRPSALGGLDAFGNKRPRHWQGNRSAGGLLANALARSPLSPTAPPRGLMNAFAPPGLIDSPAPPKNELAGLAAALTKKPRGLL